VTLSSASGAVQVPASVTVSAGNTSATFAITTSAVTTSTLVTLSATASGTTKTTTVTVNPPPAGAAALSSLWLQRTVVPRGTAFWARVTLSGNAPVGGAVVTLQSSVPGVVHVPASVTVLHGEPSHVFAVTTSSTSRDVTATITAQYGTAARTANVTVTAK
jgi:trimeric autotransporter adhesin